MALKRLNFNMEESLVKRVDEWAEKMCIPRNAAIAVMCSQFLDSQNAIATLGTLAEALKAEEAKKYLEEQNGILK